MGIEIPVLVITYNDDILLCTSCLIYSVATNSHSYCLNLNVLLLIL